MKFDEITERIRMLSSKESTKFDALRVLGWYISNLPYLEFKEVPLWQVATEIFGSEGKIDTLRYLTKLIEKTGLISMYHKTEKDQKTGKFRTRTFIQLRVCLD